MRGLNPYNLHYPRFQRARTRLERDPRNTATLATAYGVCRRLARGLTATHGAGGQKRVYFVSAGVWARPIKRKKFSRITRPCGCSLLFTSG